MKDARFKELLNLHLDHRLSSAEAEELEAALREDPARRKALRDYEAMQSACAALFARLESQAPSSQALRRSLRAAETRIDNPRTFRDGWAWPTWGVTGGLAACVALVVARLSQPALSTAQEESPARTSAPRAAQPLLATVVAPEAGESSSFGRTALPRQITFAALGLNPDSANADSASRWILQADETGSYAAIEPSVLPAGTETASSWRVAAPAAQPSSTGHFSSRPINTWTPPAGGFNVEAAAYRFER